MSDDHHCPIHGPHSHDDASIDVYARLVPDQTRFQVFVSVGQAEYPLTVDELRRVADAAIDQAERARFDASLFNQMRAMTQLDRQRLPVRAALQTAARTVVALRQTVPSAPQDGLPLRALATVVVEGDGPAEGYVALTDAGGRVLGHLHVGEAVRCGMVLHSYRFSTQLDSGYLSYLVTVGRMDDRRSALRLAAERPQFAEDTEPAGRGRHRTAPHGQVDVGTVRLPVRVDRVPVYNPGRANHLWTMSMLYAVNPAAAHDGPMLLDNENLIRAQEQPACQHCGVDYSPTVAGAACPGPT